MHNIINYITYNKKNVIVCIVSVIVVLIFTASLEFIDPIVCEKESLICNIEKVSILCANKDNAIRFDGLCVEYNTDCSIHSFVEYNTKSVVKVNSSTSCFVQK